MKPIWVSIETMQENGRRTSALLFKRRQEIYDSNPKFCRNCFKKIPYKRRNNKFCNGACAAIVNNVLYPKRTGNTSDFVRRGPKQKITKTCANCGVILKATKYRCCSSNCRDEYRINRPFDVLSKDDKRTRILKEQEVKCLICENDIWMEQKIPLEIDHINGNREDNTRENLRALCPNCHAQTPTYKFKNAKTQYITDEQIIETLRMSSSVNMAALKLGMSPQRNTYRRFNSITLID